MKITQEQIDKLPSWATHFVHDARHNVEYIEVDVDSAYPVYLKALGLEKSTFSAEVVRRCVTETLKSIVGPGLSVRLVSSTGAWKLASLPDHPDYGDESAQKGSSMFKKFYAQLKNSSGEF